MLDQCVQHLKHKLRKNSNDLNFKIKNLSLKKLNPKFSTRKHEHKVVPRYRKVTDMYMYIFFFTILTTIFLAIH